MSDTRRLQGPAYAVPSHVLHNEVDGEMVLLDLATETYFGLDTIGADMVARLTTQPLDQVVDDLIRDYDVDPEVVRRDLEDLVERLHTAGLLERVDGSDG